MLKQSEADELFQVLRAGLNDTKFEPSDTFSAIVDALESQAYIMALAIARNAQNVLENMSEEQEWHEISLEIYRRTFYSVEDMVHSGIIAYVSDKATLETMTYYVIAAMNGKEIDPVPTDEGLH